MPVVPKKPEPEKKVPPPGLKKAVAPPAKGISPRTGMRLLHQCATVVLDSCDVYPHERLLCVVSVIYSHHL